MSIWFLCPNTLRFGNDLAACHESFHASPTSSKPDDWRTRPRPSSSSSCSTTAKRECEDEDDGRGRARGEQSTGLRYDILSPSDMGDGNSRLPDSTSRAASRDGCGKTSPARST